MRNAEADPVLTYLKANFQGARIELVDDESTRRAGTRFYAITDHPDVGDLEISLEFLEDHTPEEVTRELNRREVADHLWANRGRVVLMTQDGFLLR